MTTPDRTTHRAAVYLATTAYAVAMNIARTVFMAVAVGSLIFSTLDIIVWLARGMSDNLGTTAPMIGVTTSIAALWCGWNGRMATAAAPKVAEGDVS